MWVGSECRLHPFSVPLPHTLFSLLFAEILCFSWPANCMGNRPPCFWCCAGATTSQAFSVRWFAGPLLHAERWWAARDMPLRRHYLLEEAKTTMKPVAWSWCGTMVFVPLSISSSEGAKSASDWLRFECQQWQSSPDRTLLRLSFSFVEEARSCGRMRLDTS